MKRDKPTYVPFPESQASVMLDLFRGVAALMVLIEHGRNLMFVPWRDLTVPRGPWFPFYLLSGAGHQAVVIFFLLSGYLISSSIFRARARGQWSWRSYSEHRLVRLWIVLLPALVLGLLLDNIGSRLPRAEWLYFGDHASGMLQNAAQHLGWFDFAGNAVFLQTIFVNTLGTNGALWSLSNEFWYYVLFPLALISLRGPAGPFRRVLFGVVAIIVGITIGRPIMSAFPIWLLGAALNFVNPKILSRWLLIPVLPAFLALFFVRTSLGLARDYALAAVSFLLLAILLGLRQRAKADITTKLSRNLARFSYTLYLVHTPFLVLVVGFLVEHPLQPSAIRFFLFALILAAALLYAWIVASLTEFHTDSVRRSVSRLLDRRGLALLSPAPDPRET